MANQYFKFKLKDEFLPKIINEYIQNGKIKCEYYDYAGRPSLSAIYYIEFKYFRKLKIQNIMKDISKEEKELLEFLINESFTKLITLQEYESLKNSGPIG